MSENLLCQLFHPSETIFDNLSQNMNLLPDNWLLSDTLRLLIRSDYYCITEFQNFDPWVKIYILKIYLKILCMFYNFEKCKLFSKKFLAGLEKVLWLTSEPSTQQIFS